MEFGPRSDGHCSFFTWDLSSAGEKCGFGCVGHSNSIIAKLAKSTRHSWLPVASYSSHLDRM